MSLPPIKFRTTGAWGAGQPAKLAPVDVDGNFYNLRERVTAIETSPPAPVEITNITQSGNQITVHMSDLTTWGPFTLPTNNVRWRGAWATATVYAYNDFIKVETAEYKRLYLCQIGHTSGATFDPALTISGEPAWALALDITGLGGGGGIAGVVATSSAGPINPILAQANFLWDLTYYQAADIQNNKNNIEVVIPNDATVNFPIGTMLRFRRSGNGINLYPAGGCTVDYPDGKDTRAGPYGSIITVIKKAANNWHQTGDLREVAAAVNITAANYDLLVETYINHHLVNHATGTTITLYYDSSRSYIIGQEFLFVQMGAGKVTFVKQASATLYCKGVNNRTTGQYAVAKLRYLGGDAWLLYGDVE